MKFNELLKNQQHEFKDAEFARYAKGAQKVCMFTIIAIVLISIILTFTIKNIDPQWNRWIWGAFTGLAAFVFGYSSGALYTVEAADKYLAKKNGKKH